MHTVGTGGSVADPNNGIYPVPYDASDFNWPCGVANYNNKIEVSNCELVGMRDLNQGKPWVRDRIVDLFNKLVDIGVAGFRIDAAKHMWPGDLEIIYNRINPLSTVHGFVAGARPYIYQEVIDLGGESVSKYDYNSLGAVTEFGFSSQIGRIFRRYNALHWARSWGPAWSFLPSGDALVFVNNHDNQRGHGGGGADVLTYKDARPYKMATAFELAHPYGTTRIMSSFYFESTDQGPPQDSDGNIISPSINADGTCGNGWVCEHRWRQITNMVAFRNACENEQMSNWWDNGSNQVAFARGNKGFIAFNNDLHDLNARLNTGLAAGIYCDIISGEHVDDRCSSISITVEQDGYADINVSSNAFDGVVAFFDGPLSRLR